MIVTTDDTNYKNIANAIRSKTGKTDKILPSSMPSEIESIQSGGSDAEITNCYYLFYRNSRLDSLEEILGMCKNVTTTESMFQECTQLTTLDLSNFDNSKNTNMISMFQACSKLNTLNLSNFDTSRVTTFRGLFSGCGEMTNYDLSSFNTSNAESLQAMFLNNVSLKNIDLSNFDTSKATSFYQMFHGNIKNTSINVSSFDTSKATNMSYMFYNCAILEKLDISNFVTSDLLITNAYMFQYCTNLKTLIINNPNLFKITNVNAFSNSLIASGTGYVYVPDNMVETYKTATNWSTYADQIKPISELPIEEA